MKADDKYKDGVTLMADAIRREIAEEEKAKQQTVTGNVSDATAQFSGKTTSAPQKASEQPKTSESTAEEQLEDTQPDGTMYTE